MYRNNVLSLPCIMRAYLFLANFFLLKNEITSESPYWQIVDPQCLPSPQYSHIVCLVLFLFVYGYLQYFGVQESIFCKKQYRYD